MSGAANGSISCVTANIPVRAGRKISTATLLSLFRDVPNCLALKDAAGNPANAGILVDAHRPVAAIR